MDEDDYKSLIPVICILSFLIGAIFIIVLVDTRSERISEEVLDEWCKEETNNSNAYFPNEVRLHQELTCILPPKQVDSDRVIIFPRGRGIGGEKCLT